MFFSTPQVPSHQAKDLAKGNSLGEAVAQCREYIGQKELHEGAGLQHGSERPPGVEHPPNLY